MKRALFVPIAILMALLQPRAMAGPELDRLRDQYRAAVSRTLKPLTDSYKNELLKLRDSFAKSGNLKAAVELDNELQSIGLGIAGSGQVQAIDGQVQIPANDANGYRLGPVRKGDVISRSYVAGLWKNDGIVASENSDLAGSSRGEAIRLVIAQASSNEKPGPLITVVRPGTKNSPFSYTFPMDHDDVVLRINSGTRQSPRTVTCYVKITRS